MNIRYPIYEGVYRILTIEQAEQTETIKNKRVRFEHVVLLTKLGNINLF